MLYDYDWYFSSVLGDACCVGVLVSETSAANSRSCRSLTALASSRLLAMLGTATAQVTTSFTNLIYQRLYSLKDCVKFIIVITHSYECSCSMMLR